LLRSHRRVTRRELAREARITTTRADVPGGRVRRVGTVNGSQSTTTEGGDSQMAKKAKAAKKKAAKKK
jgi:hypothetical protein